MRTDDYVMMLNVTVNYITNLVCPVPLKRSVGCLSVPPRRISSSPLGITREELQCIKNLTEENIKLKRLLKAREKELTQKSLDLETVRTEKE